MEVLYWFPEIVFACLLFAVITYFTSRFIPAINPDMFERIWERKDFDWSKFAGYWNRPEHWYKVTYEPVQQIYRYQRGTGIFFVAVMRKIGHYDFIGRKLKRPCQVKVDAVFYRHAVVNRLYRIWG